MKINLIFCFLKLAKQINFQFISVEYFTALLTIQVNNVSIRRGDLKREYSFLVREERELQQVETFPVRPWEGMVFETPSQAN